MTSRLKHKTYAFPLRACERVSLCIWDKGPSHFMSKRRKTSGPMWINPHSNIKGRPVEWDRRETDAHNARYLDLAEIALRPVKPNSKNADAAQPPAIRQAKP